MCMGKWKLDTIGFDCKFHSFYTQDREKILDVCSKKKINKNKMTTYVNSLYDWLCFYILHTKRKQLKLFRASCFDDCV